MKLVTFMNMTLVKARVMSWYQTRFIKTICNEPSCEIFLRIHTRYALAVHGLNCADESGFHKTINVSKVSVNPYIYINFLLHNHVLLPKTSYFPRKIWSKDSDTYNVRILLNSHFVPKTHPFVGSSNNVTFIVTSSKMTSFLRQNVTLFIETSSEKTTLHQSSGVSIISTALFKVKSPPVLLDYECRRFLK